MEVVETEADVILVHHLDHPYAVEDAILIPVQDLPVAVILVEENDLIPADDVVILVDVAILVAEATLEV